MAERDVERLTVESDEDRRRLAGSCTCLAVPGNPKEVSPDCAYHRVAAEHPMDHTIPWNCPTYWDGCNCKRELNKDALRAALARAEAAERALGGATKKLRSCAAALRTPMRGQNPGVAAELERIVAALNTSEERDG